MSNPRAAGAPSCGAGSPEAKARRSRAVNLLSRRLQVEAVKKSNVIAITYEGATPELAQTVVARLVELGLFKKIASSAGKLNHLCSQRYGWDLDYRDRGLSLNVYRLNWRHPWVSATNTTDPWTLPDATTIPAPAALFIRPTGYVAWVSDGAPNLADLRKALTAWCGAAHHRTDKERVNR